MSCTFYTVTVLVVCKVMLIWYYLLVYRAATGVRAPVTKSPPVHSRNMLSEAEIMLILEFSIYIIMIKLSSSILPISCTALNNNCCLGEQKSWTYTLCSLLLMMKNAICIVIFSPSSSHWKTGKNSVGWGRWQRCRCGPGPGYQTMSWSGADI